jgi:catechol 2,3-dioxygenase-like lactoylglutathione lyase family enzyme
MELVAGIGHDGYRHYFLRFGDSQVAFFEYDGAQPMVRKFHGVKTDKPLGFDHVSFTIGSKEELFALKDKLEAAGLEVDGAIDHGTMWSIYFFDPNNIPLEISWDCLELTSTPAMDEDDPLDIVAEGSGPQPGIWPEPGRHTPAEEMRAKPGNGYSMRETFLKAGLARLKQELPEPLSQ